MGIVVKYKLVDGRRKGVNFYNFIFDNIDVILFRHISWIRYLIRGKFVFMPFTIGNHLDMLYTWT